MYIKDFKNWKRIYEAAEDVETAVDRLSEFGEVKKGDKNTDGVILLQTILRDAGKLTGKSGPLKDGVDGDFGGGTEASLNRFIGKTSYAPEDAETLTTKMEETGKDFSETLSSFETIKDKIETALFGPKIEGVYADKYGESIGITDKNAIDFKIKVGSLNLPESGPIGNLAKSAWANLNVPTRGISDTNNGNLGCAAAVSIIFYRATGLPIRKGRSGAPIEVSTANLWTEFTQKNKTEWTMIQDWRTQHQPGDIILTSRGAQPGHVGIVVEGGKIISNTSLSFKGDKPGQIEQNYTIYPSDKSWEDVAKKNPQQTALFRYTGPYLDGWGGNPIPTTSGSNDNDEILQDMELPVIVVRPRDPYATPLPVQSLDTLSIPRPIRPSQLKIVDGSPDILGSSKESENKKTE